MVFNNKFYVARRQKLYTGNKIYENHLFLKHPSNFFSYLNGEMHFDPRHNARYGKEEMNL